MTDDIGARIKQARELLGWSQEKLAEKARVNRKTVANIELGKTRRLRNATSRFEQALGISLGPAGSAESAAEAKIERMRHHLMSFDPPLSQDELERMVITYRRLLLAGDERKEA